MVMKEVAKTAAVHASEMPQEASKLLSIFSDIAPEQLPNELPPMRNVQHAIDLKTGSQLPNLEYAELKRQVDKLLFKGFIRESLNPLCCPCFTYAKEKW